MKTISVIGGDLRQITLCRLLRDDGFSVLSCGLDKDGALYDELFLSDLIILPIPVCGGSASQLNAPFAERPISLCDIAEKIKPGSVVIGGKIPPDILSRLSAEGVRCIDCLSRGDLAVKNAVPTSEGAIEIAMGELPITIFGSACLVIGYGRIGRVLSRMLAGLGADVSVAARRAEALAAIETDGYKSVKISETGRTIHKFNVIFNTVPALVLDAAALLRVAPDSLVIDLSSKPGGVDFAAAGEAGVKVIWALSLPGKCAPVSSGAILKDTVINIINELKERNE